MRMRHAHLAAVMALPWLSLPQRVDAQLAAWLDFPTIRGEATDEEHLGWIEIEGFETSFQRTITRSGENTQTRTPSVLEITLTKRLDKASPKLFTAAAAGSTPYREVTLDLNSGTTPLARIELEEVLISGQTFAFSDDQEGRASESITLNFTKISFVYYESDFGGQLRGMEYAQYDLTTSGGTGAGPDSDNDGLPDAWENFYGLAVGSNDSGSDPDGDGFTSLEEYQLGTHPKSGSSFFKATITVNPATPGSHQLTWNSVAGKTYVIEWTPQLGSPFTTLRIVTATAATTNENVAKSGTLGFYRVRPQ